MNEFPASQILLHIIFAVCLLTLVIGALIAVTSSRLMRSVSGLAVCSLGLAGLYYFLHSPFLSLMEILIYIGAVCVILVFAVMLAEAHEPVREENSNSTVFWTTASLGVAGALFFGLLKLATSFTWSTDTAIDNDGSINAIGVSLLTHYSLAFELISLALLVAIIGAIAIARTGRSRQQ